MPRPTKLTSRVTEQVALAVYGAAAFKSAAKRAGVGETTFHRWMARGRVERTRLEVATLELESLPRARSEKARARRRAAQRAAEPKASEARFLEFAERIELADAEAQVRTAAQIAELAASDWRAGAWLLERRDPGTFGPPEARVAVEGGSAVLIPSVPGSDHFDAEESRLAHELLAHVAARRPPTLMARDEA